MSNNGSNIFASEEYFLLRWMSENTVKIDKKQVVKFSQAEIAEGQKNSPTTINKRMQILQKSDCIRPYGRKGNYEITDTGFEIIKCMSKIEKIIGGKKNG